LPHHCDIDFVVLQHLDELLAVTGAHADIDTRVPSPEI